MRGGLADGDVWLGIAAGVLSGGCMSLSYLMSRHHALTCRVADRPRASVGLLVRSHLIMGIVCMAIAAWRWPAEQPSLAGYGPPLAVAAGLYLLGNFMLFALLRRTEASRLTPFLGLKILMLAAIVAVVLGQPLSARQWMAVALSILATALLQGRTGGLPRDVLGRLLVVCLFFAVADLCIVRMIDQLQAESKGEGGRFAAAILAMLLNYAACGAACGIFIACGRPRIDPGTATAWRAAAAYAAAWLLAMASLYVCFAFIGAVLGNVVQSTRGIMSIVIGAALAHLGWHELEQRVDGATLMRRVGAAVLMTAAIAVYVL